VKYPRVISRLVAYPLHFFHTVIAPIRWVLMMLSMNFTRLFGGKMEYEQDNGFTTDEVKALVDIGSEEGVITDEEMKLVASLFKLEDVPAYKLMTPSVDCFVLPLNIAWRDAIYEIKKRGYSRTPVYDGDKDNIVGVLYSKDILTSGLSGAGNPGSLLRPPYFIPRTKMAFDLLTEFQHKRNHIAIVVDEYGRFDGLVTLEDILEELFGEIEDERRVLKKPRNTRHDEDRGVQRYLSFHGAEVRRPRQPGRGPGTVDTSAGGRPRDGRRVHIRHVRKISEGRRERLPRGYYVSGEQDLWEAHNRDTRAEEGRRGGRCRLRSS
jgi:CBS domain containing-hemolysin-like protein